jgi:beta-alanine degradation protein BauB
MKESTHLFIIVLFATAALMIAAKTSVAQDSIEVSPHTYKVLLENDRVRVLEYRSQPGEKSPMASASEAVIYRLSPSYKLKFTFPDGKTELIEAKAGDVRWREEGMVEIENVGDTEAHAVIVELKK